ncbi:MAG: polymerase beta domain protein region protein [Candidatus Falkowbacteria bacterium GW2011_GWA2_39_24]|uniref:Polymerase beta domain protein region protein n=1 Tax=Candidatus Falkowbacteria bacterium GW2011_GWA2_39_24 TaxID=1618634 RepID=A0A0G0NGK8_9BACT|nr:MAG: polymerase beta domain protein region protein [Candidatus Falkowbacteria bacterium GW2011_GWA2_39_24]
MTEEIQKIKDIVVPIFQEAGFTYAGIFGSVARGEATTNSDIDLLYDHPKDLKFSLFDLAGLKIKLEDSLGLKVDLARLGNLKPRVVPYIKNDLIILYEKG